MLKNTLMRPLTVILMLIAASLQAQQVPASYEEQFEKRRQLLARREYFDALKAFRRANQLAGGKSAESFVGMAQAMIGMKVFKNAIDASQSATELAHGDSRVLAHTQPAWRRLPFERRFVERGNGIPCRDRRRLE
jgi:thioredoxin-like negative regulator of GroEL